MVKTELYNLTEHEFFWRRLNVRWPYFFPVTLALFWPPKSVFETIGMLKTPSSLSENPASDGEYNVN